MSTMGDSKAMMESMLFQSGTTYMSDYQLPKYSENHPTVYKKKKRTERKPVLPLKDTHTLSDIRTTAVPFDLMIKRKDITRTHPRMPQKKNEQEIDTGLEEAIRTRPRLVMTPAAAVDDLLDKHARDLIIAETYTSSTTQMFQQSVKPYFSLKAPLVEQPAPAQPITLPSLQLPKVPQEWKMETITWDSKQLRGFSDPDREFWIEHRAKMKECSVCKETSLVTKQRDLQRQRKMNAARR